MIPYQPRAIRFQRLVPHAGWTIKLYSIAHGGRAFDEAPFASGLRMALDALPAPARTQARPGVGFAILHQGNGCDYAVIAWWDRENELPLRVFVRDGVEPSFRAARGSESICVWDLEVIGFERDAYVRTLLADPAREASEYLRVTRPIG